jgi:hypothetical protein
VAGYGESDSGLQRTDVWLTALRQLPREEALNRMLLGRACENVPLHITINALAGWKH